MRLLLITAIIPMLLVGCGRKGDLRLEQAQTQNIAETSE